MEQQDSRNFLCGKVHVTVHFSESGKPLQSCVTELLRLHMRRGDATERSGR